MIISVIRQRKPYRWFFLCYHLLNLARFNYFSLNPGLNFGFGSDFLPSFSGTDSMLWCLDCKYCKGMLKHKQNVSQIKCHSAVCFLKLRKRSQRPGLHAQLFYWHSRWPWWRRVNDSTVSCFLPDDTWEHCKHIPEVCRFFAEFWRVMVWSYMTLFSLSSVHLFLWGPLGGEY